MARQKSPMLGIDAKMYRHFAIITVALTSGIALFADGEKREAVAQGIEAAKNYEPEQVKPKDAKLIVSKNNRANSAGMAGFYGSGASDFRSQLQVDSSVQVRGLRRGGSHLTPTAAELAMLGMTSEEFMQKSPEERAELMQSVRGGQTAAQRENAIKNATISSLSRSGGSTSADY